MKKPKKADVIIDQHQIGKKIKLSGSRITGVISCLPSHEILNNSFLKNFCQEDIDGVIKMIGVSKRRHAETAVTTRDLCKMAGENLLKKLQWDPHSVDLIIFVSQTPDFVLPPSSSFLQYEWGLSKSSISLDINLGCSGYVYAVWLGMSLIKMGAAKRALLAVGDTISKLVDPNDRSTALLFGDAGTVTALEACSNSDESFFILGGDGAGAENLIVPAGGFKEPTENLIKKIGQKDLSSLYMDGSEIFNFSLNTIPKLAKELEEFSKINFTAYDYFLFHQANNYMLNHLIKKLKLPPEKVPINIQEYGNTSSASIPLLITSRIEERVRRESLRVGMFGFGVGYSWGAASIPLGPLSVAEVQLYE